MTVQQHGEILLHAYATEAKYAEAQWAICRFLWKDGILTPLGDVTKETIAHEMTESEALTILQAKWDDEKTLNDALAEQGIIRVGGSTSSSTNVSPWVYAGIAIGIIAVVGGGVLVFGVRRRTRRSA